MARRNRASARGCRTAAGTLCTAQTGREKLRAKEMQNSFPGEPITAPPRHQIPTSRFSANERPDVLREEGLCKFLSIRFPVGVHRKALQENEFTRHHIGRDLFTELSLELGRLLKI